MPQTSDGLTRSPKRVPMPECGIVVFESRHGSGFVGELNDSYAKFHLLVSGGARWEGESRKYMVTADTLFHIAACVPHRQQDHPGDPVTLYAIHYRPALLRPELYAELAARRMLPLNLHGVRRDQGRQVRAIVQSMLFEQEARRIGWEALLVSRVTDLAVMAVRFSQGSEIAIEGSNESMARVASYAMRLKTEFDAVESLDEAARSVGLGRRRFTELFRKITGQSWRKYVHQLRMDYATKLLMSTERSVTAIAFECGFEELSHFHRSFRASFDTTPLGYREKFRPNSQS